MILDRVTITGADDSIDPFTLVKLSARFPCTEWGVLFSRKWQGHQRYPSHEWLKELMKVSDPLKLSAHLCGSWVTDLLYKKQFTWADSAEVWNPEAFRRVQLNFHGTELMYWSLDEDLLDLSPYTFILQCDGVNDYLVKGWVKQGLGLPLFDTSSGAGVLPEDGWPRAWKNVYCGYAGGLGPHNTYAEVSGPITEAAGKERIWIDMETQVRSNRDQVFDLEKVEDVLLQVKPLVTL